MTTSDRSLGWRLGIASWLAMGGANAISGDCAHAQITPDGTLGAERSVVTPNVDINGLHTDRIDGGAIRGANLFHSFQEFNVKEGRGAYFSNPAGIQNILSRVTGNDPSDILGKLGVSGGNANLFLINPNGIIFGPNASLDVGGSFVATTANAIGFGNQGFFSASTPDVPPVLTVNPSAFFFNQIAAGSIENRSTAAAGSKLLAYASGLGDDLYYFPELVFGLRVPDSRSLLLLGGDVRLDGGSLNALGGRVELGGVAGEGTVGLVVDGNNLHLSFPSDIERADVSLTNKARVDASDGDIQVQGRRITLTDGSEISARALGSEPGGNLTVTASDEVELSGEAFLEVERDLTITTERLSVRDGSQIESFDFEGPGGNLTIAASESVELSGNSADGTPSSLSALGDTAGNLTITTGRLIAQDGARVSASTGWNSITVHEATLTDQGGNLTVTASDEVELSGREPGEFGVAGGLFTSNHGAGVGGDLTIVTGRLSVRDGATVGTSVGLGAGQGGNINVTASDSVELIGTSLGGSYFTGSSEEEGQTRSGLFTDGYSTGDAGDITITTGRLLVQDGAGVSASTFGSGSGGKLTVTATDEVELSGNSADGQQRSGLFSTTTAFDEDFAEGSSAGNGGQLTIRTRQLNVRDSAQVSVSSLGSGDAGNLDVAAREIRLENLATLTAESVQGRGGNITLQARGLLLTHNNSLISAISGGFGNEGNITIDTGILAAFKNSDIIANAFAGPGANIQITAQGIFGTQTREQQTLGSDITATGTVTFNIPDIDPSQGLATLPTELIEASGLITSSCAAVGENKFIITGRGGLPPNPSDPLSSDAIWIDWVTLNPGVVNRSSPPVSTNPTTPAPTPIVEAQGWVINNKGEVVLTATAPTATPHIPWMTPVSCHTPETSS